MQPPVRVVTSPAAVQTFCVQLRTLPEGGRAAALRYFDSSYESGYVNMTTARVTPFCKAMARFGEST